MKKQTKMLLTSILGGAVILLNSPAVNSADFIAKNYGIKDTMQNTTKEERKKHVDYVASGNGPDIHFDYKTKSELVNLIKKLYGQDVLEKEKTGEGIAYILDSNHKDDKDYWGLFDVVNTRKKIGDITVLTPADVPMFSTLEEAKESMQYQTLQADPNMVPYFQAFDVNTNQDLGLVNAEGERIFKSVPGPRTGI